MRFDEDGVADGSAATPSTVGNKRLEGGMERLRRCSERERPTAARLLECRYGILRRPVPVVGRAEGLTRVLGVQVADPAAHGVSGAGLDELGALGRVVVDAAVLDPVHEGAVGTQQRGDDLNALRSHKN